MSKDTERRAGEALAAETLLDGDEILEALKECEYALKMAIEKDKIGWLQQVAHQTACDALNKHLAAKKAKPSKRKAHARRPTMTTADTQAVVTPTDSRNGEAGRLCVQRLVRPELRFKSATNEWSTPDDLWKPLNDEFGFTLDVCSTHENAKCANHYTLADDGLAQPWSGVCWMNPPYGAQLARWVKKCHDEAKRGALVVGLIPVRSNTSYWHNYVMGAEIRFVRGYPKFGNAKQGLKAPLAVVVWRPKWRYATMTKSEYSYSQNREPATKHEHAAGHGSHDRLVKAHKPRLPITDKNCVYPDWEGGYITGSHHYGKDGFCSICGHRNGDLKK